MLLSNLVSVTFGQLLALTAALQETAPVGLASYDCLDEHAPLQEPGTQCLLGDQAPWFRSSHHSEFVQLSTQDVLHGLGNSTLEGNRCNCPSLGTDATCRRWQLNNTVIWGPPQLPTISETLEWSGWISDDLQSFRLCYGTCSGASYGAC